jgi:hypothetical protein
MRILELGYFETCSGEVGTLEINLVQGSSPQVCPVQVKAPPSLLLTPPVPLTTPFDYCQNRGYIGRNFLSLLYANSLGPKSFGVAFGLASLQPEEIGAF